MTYRLSNYAMTKKWVNPLVELIFEAESQNHKKKVEEFVTKNNELLQNYNPGFHFLGVRYSIQPEFKGALSSLHKNLVEEVGKYHNYFRNLQLDKSVIEQTLHTLLLPCGDDQDVRDALPETMVSLVPVLSAYPRTRAAAWTLKDNPRALQRFERMSLKIDAYCASGLLY